MAVILNTGSQDMKNAVNQLNTPLSQASDIPTQVDTRADADTVIKTMDQAKQEASQSSGVPQSPFTNTGKTHQPLDAYLHNLFTEITGIFGDTFEAVKECSWWNFNYSYSKYWFYNIIFKCTTNTISYNYIK